MPTMNLKNASILIVDDDLDVLTAVRLLLKTEAKEVVTEKNPENLRWHLSRDQYDMILLDMNFNSSINTGNEGIFWLKEIRKLKPDMAVIMITAYGDIDLAIRSLKEGASDFVVKPWHNEKLLTTIKDTLRHRGSKGNKAGSTEANSIIGRELLGESEAMQKVMALVARVAPMPSTVLVTGESGTGKEVVPRELHRLSGRQGQFVGLLDALAVAHEVEFVVLGAQPHRGRQFRQVAATIQLQWDNQTSRR